MERRQALKSAALVFAVVTIGGFAYGRSPLLWSLAGSAAAVDWAFRLAAAGLAYALFAAWRRLKRADPLGWPRVAAAWAAGGAAGFAAAWGLWTAVGTAVFESTVAEAARRGYRVEASAVAAPDPAQDVNALNESLRRLPSMADETRNRDDAKFLTDFLAGVSTRAPTAAELARAEAVVARRADTLPLLERGAAMERPAWPLPRDPILDSPVPIFLPLTLSARVAAARAVLQARAGRVGEAVESVRLALAAGRLAAGEDRTMGTLMEAYVTGCALSAARIVLQSGGAQTARARWAPYLDGAARLDAFHRVTKRDFLALTVPYGRLSWWDLAFGKYSGRRRRDAFLTTFMYLWPLTRFDVAAYLRTKMTIGDLMDKPFSEARAGWTPTVRRVYAQRWVLSDYEEPDYTRSYEQVMIAAARASLARAAIAASLEKSRTGRWPEAVSELDPFTDKPLKLARLSDGKLALYSLGPDGVDDAGAPYDVASRKGDVVWRLE